MPLRTQAAEGEGAMLGGKAKTSGSPLAPAIGPSCYRLDWLGNEILINLLESLLQDIPAVSIVITQPWIIFAPMIVMMHGRQLRFIRIEQNIDTSLKVCAYSFTGIQFWVLVKLLSHVHDDCGHYSAVFSLLERCSLKPLKACTSGKIT